MLASTSFRVVSSLCVWESNNQSSPRRVAYSLGLSSERCKATVSKTTMYLDYGWGKTIPTAQAPRRVEAKEIGFRVRDDAIQTETRTSNSDASFERARTVLKMSPGSKLST